jgi:signal transduction histidine kinase
MRNRVKQDAAVQAVAAQIDGMLKEAIEKSRGLSHELSPAALHHSDFTDTLRWLAGEMEAKHGLVVRVHAPGTVRLQSESSTAILFRAVQELLFNVVKHARVSQARVRVRQRGAWVCVSVSDRGRGFDPQDLLKVRGYGLLSIRERIELLGGRVKIRSAPGRGSTVFVMMPDGEG